MRESFPKINSAHSADADCANCGLAAWGLPADLAPAERARINQITEHRHPIRSGDYLAHAGDSLTSLYTVKSGSLKTMILDDDGRAQLIGFSFPGEIIGMDAISTGKYPTDVIALEDASCCGIHYAGFNFLCQSVQSLQNHLHQAMSREIKRSYQLMFMLGSLSADERLAAFLLNLLERHSARGYSGLQLRLSMSRQDIGSYLGLKLETVSRIFTRLKDEQILDVSGRYIIVKNPQRLQMIADSTGVDDVPVTRQVRGAGCHAPALPDATAECSVAAVPSIAASGR